MHDGAAICYMSQGETRMPVSVEWYNDDETIIYMAMVGKWTWDEAYRAQKEGDALLEAANHNVGAIIDFARSSGIPLSAMSNARSMTQKQNPKVKATVFLGASPLFMSLWNVFNRVYPKFSKSHPFFIADTPEKAREILLGK